MPQAQTQNSSTQKPQPQFIDIYAGDVGSPREVAIYTGASRRRQAIRIVTSKGYVLSFTKRGLTQLLHALGYTRRDLETLTEQDILKAWERLDASVVFSAYKWNGVYSVYRVTSDLYTPIPHRVLFQHVTDVLKDAGFNVEPEVKRHNVRVGARWLLWSIPLNYARPGDAVGIYLVVSNANTGDDSIKVYGFAEIVKCRNGLILGEVKARVRVFHVHGLQGVLERVREAVLEVIKKLAETKEELKSRIERLQEIQMTPKKREEWLKRLFETLPKKYHPYLMEQWARNRREFGETAEALFQTVTALIPRVRNEEVRGKLNKHAQELLALAVARR
jgi:hypothetical protein